MKLEVSTRPNGGTLGRKEEEEQAFQTEGPAYGRAKVIVLGKQMRLSVVRVGGVWGGVVGSQRAKWGPGDQGAGLGEAGRAGQVAVV